MTQSLGTWDVIIVGGGGAGLAAAVAAARESASVLVLEKGPQVGGSTAKAIGSISAPGTRLQSRRRIGDNVASFLEDSQAFTGELGTRDNLTIRTLLANEAAATVEFLEHVGVQFVGPFLEPPHTVPRMLNAVPNGRAYVIALEREARRLGVTVITSAPASQLLVDGERVVGAVVETGGATSVATARHGLVLAAGDYSTSPEFLAQYLEPGAGGIGAVNPLNTGDGHRMGVEIGAQLVNMDVVDGPQLRFPPPPTGTLLDRLPTGGLAARVVAAVGNRLPARVLRLLAKQLLAAWMAPSRGFIREAAVLVDADGMHIDSAPPDFVYTVAERRDQTAYLLMTEASAAAAERSGRYVSTAPGIAFAQWSDYRRGRRDLVLTGNTVTDIACKLGVEADVLSRSIERSPLRDFFASGPFFALGPARVTFVVTEGWLRIDDHCRVLARDGGPIPGLYAAGSNGQGGLVLWGHGHHILWAVTSGRVAGRMAARGR